MAQLENPPEAALRDGNIPTGLRIAAIVLRTLFIIVLVLITFRVSRPQNETFWTAYDTPSDMVLMLLGFGVAAWLVVQLFRGPRDLDGYRTWFYLGLALVPFSVICLVAVW
jgi:hypothetical protein